ncbi:MAG: hypothetical protein L6R40_007558 [Gallowayella cf. fulva]|nr:MAG: hypothetical protein L6R40_007558 [Xanthomendoza cf. fulva]
MDGQLPPPPYSLEDPAQHQPAAAFVQGHPNPRDGTAFVSGAAYFHMRPTIHQRPVNILPCHIAVFADTTAADLPMPKPNRILVDRDLSLHDWETFVNHLVLCHTATSSTSAVEEKVGKRQPGALGSEKNPHALSAGEPQRQQRVKAVVKEWNQGFFMPRGIEIVVRVNSRPQQQTTREATSSRPFHPRSPEEHSPRCPTTYPERQGKRNKDKDLGLALHSAIMKEDFGIAKMLLEAGADPDVKPPGATPGIVEAVKRTQIDLLKLLLDYNPDVEAHAAGAGTALYTAATKGKADMVKVLLSHGANPNNRPSGAEPALYKALSKQYHDIVELLLRVDNLKIDDTPPGGSTTMYLAAMKGNLQIVKALLTAGAKADAKPPGGNTAMFEAAKKGNYEVCQVLLEKGAEVDAKRSGGDTALHTIVGKQDVDLIRLLLDHGASTSAKTCGGETVLQKAVSKGNQEQVKLLLQYSQKSTHAHASSVPKDMRSFIL